MGDVLFYHLTRSSAEETLFNLLPRALDKGWLVELRCPDPQRAEQLDKALWLGPEEGFLPHGLAGGQDADQPILITHIPADPPRACVMSLSGAVLASADVEIAERACILFDGHDPEAVQHARGQWRTLTDTGCRAQYWSQEGGGWEKKAESGA